MGKTNMFSQLRGVIKSQPPPTGVQSSSVSEHDRIPNAFMLLTLVQLAEDQSILLCNCDRNYVQQHPPFMVYAAFEDFKRTYYSNLPAKKRDKIVEWVVTVAGALTDDRIAVHRAYIHGCNGIPPEQHNFIANMMTVLSLLAKADHIHCQTVHMHSAPIQKIECEVRSFCKGRSISTVDELEFLEACHALEALCFKMKKAFEYPIR